MTYLVGYSLTADAEYPTFPWCEEVYQPWLLWVVWVMDLRRKGMKITDLFCVCVCLTNLLRKVKCIVDCYVLAAGW